MSLLYHLMYLNAPFALINKVFLHIKKWLDTTNHQGINEVFKNRLQNSPSVSPFIGLIKLVKTSNKQQGMILTINLYHEYCKTNVGTFCKYITSPTTTRCIELFKSGQVDTCQRLNATMPMFTWWNRTVFPLPLSPVSTMVLDFVRLNNRTVMQSETSEK